MRDSTDCVLIKVENISTQCGCTMSLQWFLKMTHCLYAVDSAPLNNQVNLKQSEGGFSCLLVSSCWPSIPQGSVVHHCTDNISTTLGSSGIHLQIAKQIILFFLRNQSRGLPYNKSNPFSC